MKNKKLIILLIVVLILLFSIPIIVAGFPNFIISVEKILTEEETRQKREEERANWLNSVRSEETQVTTYTEDEKISIDETLLEKSKVIEKETKEERNKMDEIIKRFYKDEYEELLKQFTENANKMYIDELYNQPSTKRIFELILDVIENENITNEEKTILKEFLDLQYYVIEDNTLKSKIENVLENK